MRIWRKVIGVPVMALACSIAQAGLVVEFDDLSQPGVEYRIEDEGAEQ